MSRAGLLAIPLLAMAFVAPVRAQCDVWKMTPLNYLDPTLAGANGPLRAAEVWDPDGTGPISPRLVVGGSFSRIGYVEADRIAYYDPDLRSWRPFGAGVRTEVEDIAIVDGQVYIACRGDHDPATRDTTVQRWTGTGWQAIGWTERGTVYTILGKDGQLYIGGTFETHHPVDGTKVANFAAYDPVANGWLDVASGAFGDFLSSGGVSNAVEALHVYEGFVVAGGYVRESGYYVPKLMLGNAGGIWSPIVSTSSPAMIRALADYGGELLVGGNFQEIDGVAASGIAAWNWFTGYRALDGGVGSNGSVRTIELFDGIVIGGFFDSAGGSNAPNVAQMLAGQNQWQGLGTQGPDGGVFDLVVYGDRLIAVGSFFQVPAPAESIASWTGSIWSPVSGGSSSGITSFALFNGRLAVGGSFQATDLLLNSMNHVATYSPSSWSGLGTGMNAQVHALEAFKYPGFNGSHELIAGGAFTNAGGVTALRIARWNERPNVAFPPPAWEPMGSGFNSNVNAIERASGFTYAGGTFTFSGTTPVSRVARWNETTDVWESVGGGTNGHVHAIKEFAGQLYVGGSFTVAGGVATGGLARWNGSSWSAVGGGFDGTVYALEVHDGSLFVGGQFQSLPGGANVARFDGANWFTVAPASPNGAVHSLRSNGTDLYMGGAFTTIGGTAIQRFARWTGDDWEPVLGGTNGTVQALAWYQGEMHVGGTFTSVTAPTYTAPLNTWVRLEDEDLPVIHTDPTSQVGEILGQVTFVGSATGSSSPITYQWLHRDVPLVDGPRIHGSFVSGADDWYLTIENLVLSDAGEYRLEATNGCGTVSTAPAVLSYGVTSVEPGRNTPDRFDGAGPNPGSGPTTLSFTLGRSASVGFTVHDARGRRVRTIDVGHLDSGVHHARWDARDEGGHEVAAGIYFVRLELDGAAIATRRVTILR